MKTNSPFASSFASRCAKLKYYDILEKWKENHPEHLQHIYEKIRVWTVNDPNEITQLLDLNVKAIITDDPERAVRITTRGKL